MANSAKTPKYAPYFIEDEESIVLYSDDRNITISCAYVPTLPIFQEKEYYVTFGFASKKETNIEKSITDMLNKADTSRISILYAASQTGRFKKAIKSFHKDSLELCYFEKRAKQWLEEQIWDICNQQHIDRVSAIKHLIYPKTI